MNFYLGDPQELVLAQGEFSGDRAEGELLLVLRSCWFGLAGWRCKWGMEVGEERRGEGRRARRSLRTCSLLTNQCAVSGQPSLPAVREVQR